MRVRRLVTGARRRQAASGSASSIAEDVAAPRVSSCLVVALPALGRVANRCRAGGLLRQAHHVGTSASRAEGLGQRGSERLAGRGSQTTCRTSAWRGPAAVGRCRGRAPGGPRPCARAGPGTDAQHRRDVRGPSARQHKPKVKGPPARRPRPVRQDPGCRAAHDSRSALPRSISVSAAPSRPRPRWPGDPAGRLTVPPVRAVASSNTRHDRDLSRLC